jgi:hypothetical protein
MKKIWRRKKAMKIEFCQCCHINDDEKQCSEKANLYDVVYGNAPDEISLSCKEHVEDMGCDPLYSNIFSHECEHCFKEDILREKVKLIFRNGYFETKGVE